MNKENLKKTKFEKIKKGYLKGDVCMSELLATIPADGLSVEEAFELYSEVIEWASGDTVKVVVQYDEDYESDDIEFDEVFLNKVQTLKVSDNLVIFDINKLLDNRKELLDYQSTDKKLNLKQLKKFIPEINDFIISDGGNTSNTFIKINDEQPTNLIKDIVIGGEEIYNKLDNLIESSDKMVITREDTFGAYYYEELIKSPRVKSKSMGEFSEMYEAIILENFKGEVALWDVTNLEGSTWRVLIGTSCDNPAESFVLIMDDYIQYSE